MSEYLSLCAELKDHDHAYYILGTPAVPDREYDTLYRRLLDMEAADPSLVFPDSPSQRVGAAPISGFVQVQHSIPMQSLDNTYSSSELMDFLARVGDGCGADIPTFTIEPKIDGLAFSLIYKHGHFQQAITRGDGSQGDDISHNVRTIRSIPMFVPRFADLETVELRGEIYMPKAGFDALNRRCEEAGKPLYANPRNAAVGAIKLLDSREAAKRPLDAFLYSVVVPSNMPHVEALEWLKDAGLPVFQYYLADTPALVWKCIQSIDDARRSAPYPTDGAVIKVVEPFLRERLGTTSKAPRWGFAYKFQADQGRTILKSVTIQVGRTGVLTPVAELEPIHVAGSTISRATLHNFADLKTKDYFIGDTVIIEKAGEVIPAVVGVDLTLRPAGAEPIKPPTHCPSCNSPAVFDDTYAYCTSATCPAQIRRRIQHFCSRSAMDIEGMGDAACDAVVDAGLVANISDIYHLTREQLLSLPLFGNLKAQQVLDGIAASKKRPLARFIFALGIQNVGATAAKKLSRRFPSLSSLLAASHEELTSVQDVGPETAASIIAFAKAPGVDEIIARLQAAGIDPQEETSIGSSLAGKTFVITGTLSKPREHFAGLIEAQGGVVSGSVSKKTHYLLAGANAGSKLDKATSLGVPVIDEASFDTLLAD